VVLGLLMTAAFRAADHAAWARVEPAVLAELERTPSLRISWATTLTMAMAMGGRFEEAASLLAKAVDVANAEGKVERAFQLEAQLATLAQIVPSVPAVDLTRYAGEIDLDGPGGRLAAALEARAAAVAGSASQAADAAKLALGNDGVIFDEEPELVAAVMSVMILVAADEVDAAQRAAEQALAIALERDIAPGIARGLSLRGFAAWACGDLVNAEADMRQAVDLVRLAGIAPLVLVFSGPLIAISVERDELPSAEAQLEALGVADGSMPGNPMFSLLRMVRGQLRFERGELERSLKDLLVFCTQADHWGPSAAAACSPWVIRGLIAAGERSRAQEIASDVKARAGRWGAPATVAQAMRADAVATGGSEGIAMLEGATVLLEDSSRRLERAYALVDLGEALRREGRRADARRPLREALRLARRCGAVRVARRANDELQATGEKVRSYAPIGVESLTPSERRVAELAASGMTNRQIAQSLFVTVKTVEAHLSAAYDKLDISSRRQLPGALGKSAG
jgi:DNA-binding CsgD family transcriptional regulator